MRAPNPLVSFACALLLAACAADGDQAGAKSPPWPPGPPPAEVVYLLHVQGGEALLAALDERAPGAAGQVRAGWGQARPEALALLDPRVHQGPLILAYPRPDPAVAVRWPSGAFAPRRIAGRHGQLPPLGFSPHAVFAEGQRAVPAGEVSFLHLRLGPGRMAGGVDEAGVELASPWLLASPPDLPAGPALWFWFNPPLAEEILAGGPAGADLWARRLAPLGDLTGAGTGWPVAAWARLLASSRVLRAMAWPEADGWRLRLRLWARTGSALAAHLAGRSAGAALTPESLSPWGLEPSGLGADSARVVLLEGAVGLELEFFWRRGR